MRRLFQSILIRLPEPLRARFLLRQQRRAQRAWDLAYTPPIADAGLLGQCLTPDDLFEFARNRFEVDQNRGEFLGLLSLLASRHPTIGCEIGTRHAGSLFMLCRGLPSLRRIAAIDLFFQRRAAFISLQRQDQDVYFIEGNSHAASTRKKLSTFLNGDHVDFLFIDGDHSYEGSKRDFEIYRSAVRPGGLVIFHDIVMDMTTRAQSPTPLSKAIAGGVPILWQELKRQYVHHEFVEDWNQDGRGIGAIEMPDH